MSREVHVRFCERRGVRFPPATLLIICFQHREDAERVAGVLRKRLAKYGLELNGEKTRLIAFGRFAAQALQRQGQGKPPTFDFLGFTHICARGRNGRFTVRLRTARKRLRRTMLRIAEWCRTYRHLPVEEQHRMLARALQGHYAYYGRRSNLPSLNRLWRFTETVWYKWLRRRDQQRRFTWAEYTNLLRRYPLPTPRVWQRAFCRS
jgi:hypothetical protein